MEADLYGHDVAEECGGGAYDTRNCNDQQKCAAGPQPSILGLLECRTHLLDRGLAETDPLAKGYKRGNVTLDFTDATIRGVDLCHETNHIGAKVLVGRAKPLDILTYLPHAVSNLVET